jgi:hypothetical protein
MPEICQACGCVAPTKYVEFYQNIGALVMRFHKGVKGNLCKKCIHKYFWKYTGTNLTLGWWGMISVVVTPIFTVNNIVRYIGCATLKPPPTGAEAPQLSPEAAAKLQPFVSQLLARLNRGEPQGQVIMTIARSAQVQPTDVALMIAQLNQRRAQLLAQNRAS